MLGELDRDIYKRKSKFYLYKENLNIYVKRKSFAESTPEEIKN